MVGSGGARHGEARCHLVGELRIVPAAGESHGEVGHGGERIGTARLCLSEWWHRELVEARRGMAGRGKVRQGHFGAMVAVTANRQGMAGQGSAGQGQARHGKVFFKLNRRL
jgi:hypothetical protein